MAYALPVEWATLALPVADVGEPADGVEVFVGFVDPFEDNGKWTQGVGLAPTIFVPASDPGALGDHFLYDYYYRIWVVPNEMNIRNPRINVDIPLAVWNAYPYNNTLSSITGTGLTGLTLDVTTPTLFKPIEYREINLQVGATAPLEVIATFNFNFVEGVGVFYFEAERASIIYMVPDVPVEEKWEWMTQVMVSVDGSEQRVALRTAPRRKIRYELVILDDDEYRRQYKRIFQDVNSQVVLPFWQYCTDITAVALTGTSTLTFDPGRTDLRAGEYTLIVGTAGNQLIKIASLTGTGCVTDTPLDLDVEIGALITPALPCMIENRSKLGMNPVYNGRLELSAQSLEPRQELSRPGSATVFERYETLPILNIRPLNNDQVTYAFDGGKEVIDSETGIVEIKSFWAHAQVEGPRQYNIERTLTPAAMDWWRDFLQEVKGQLKPFYCPSYRPDLHLKDAPSLGGNVFTVFGTDYSTTYYEHECFKVLAIETAGGVHYSRVVSAVADVNGNDVLTIADTLPGAAEWTQVTNISFCNKVRLASDAVQLQHYGLNTQIELTIRTVDG
jgi:hypothetical protein